MNTLVVFMLLLIGHFCADYPLQGDFIGRFKNRHVASPIPNAVIWWNLLTAHAFIHAGSVYFITGSVWFALIEIVSHWLIDFAKCEGKLTFNQDQALHICVKILYLI